MLLITGASLIGLSVPNLAAANSISIPKYRLCILKKETHACFSFTNTKQLAKDYALLNFLKRNNSSKDKKIIGLEKTIVKLKKTISKLQEANTSCTMSTKQCIFVVKLQQGQLTTVGTKVANLEAINLAHKKKEAAMQSKHAKEQKVIIIIAAVVTVGALVGGFLLGWFLGTTNIKQTVPLSSAQVPLGLL